VTTLAELNALVAADLRDPSYVTFSSTDVDGFVNSGVAEVGRVAPERVVIGATGDDSSLEYDLARGDNIEIRRVEVWDTSTTPETFVGRLSPASSEYINQSDVGYDLWGGVLRLTKAQNDALVANSDYELRVWAYAPYAYMTSSDDIDFGPEKEEAIRLYARLQAVRSLVSDRALFTQWQSVSHNTDVSLAALMNMYATLQQEWRQRSRALMVLREAP
jgi:hypothetical protein